MKTFNPFIYLTIISFLLVLISCSKEEKKGHTEITMDMIQASSQRSMEDVQIVAKEANASFMVFYTGDLKEILANEESVLKSIINSMDFELEKPATIDENIHGILLTTTILIDDPIAIGNKISMCKEVVMVDIKNIKAPRKEFAS